MADVVTSQPARNQSSSNQARGRGRGGRGRGRGNRNPALALRPAQVTPTSQSPADTPRSQTPQPQQQQGQSQPDALPNSNAASRSRRPRRGGVHAGRGRNERLVGQRQFGGTLTTESADGPGSAALDDDQVSELGGRSKKASAPRRRRLSRSTAPDIATRTHEDIDNGNYECPICTSEVRRNSKVWSCHTCWTVFHLGCIKQWATNSEAQAREQAARNGTTPSPQPWRCPGCNLPQESQHLAYSCWCGKDRDPRSITGLPPHSCGQTCGSQRKLPKSCPHPCELLCHAGPCPPCSQMGPTQACFCGKEESQKKCLATQYDSGWSCGQVCGESMPCGEHECQRECHEGFCGACEVRIDARCYCGQEEKAILCCDKDDEKPSKRLHLAENNQEVVETWTGLFTCSNACQRAFDCGVHLCQQLCHPATDSKTHCPRSPDLVTYCPCGKTALEELLESPRLTCEDPIPNCSKPCLNTLACGHGCKEPCHTGPCRPCLEVTTITCRCGRTTVPTVCHQGHEEHPHCMRTCHATLNCGRHACGERCCHGERKAVERLASKKKGRPLGSARPTVEDFEAEHICTRICGRTLKCGNHACQELCHKGPCGSCVEAIFDEVPCSCGRTILQPPLPCGTRPPPCRWDCERPKACGHPQVQHNCHADEETCPKCPFLMTKRCACGKSSLKNQPCWVADPRCGLVCGTRLKCGMHACRKTCHKASECEDAAGKCAQTCGRPKKLCSHPCEEACHAPYPCTQDRPCTAKKLITCPCQHKKAEVRCGASARSMSPERDERALKCDDECARIERNRALASALDIDPATLTDEHVPYAADTLAMLAGLPARFTSETETTLRAFAADNARRLHLKPMKAPERAFVHALAEDLGLDCESLDPEPHRHVALFKTPRFVAAPTKTLRDAQRIRQTQAARANAEASDKYFAQQASRAAAATSAPAPTQRSDEPFNGFVISYPRFGLTADELAAELSAAGLAITLSAHFLVSGDVGLLAPPATPDHAVRDAKPALARTLNRAGTGALQLARLADDASRVLFRESDAFAPSAAGAATGGWSHVAAAARARAPPVPAGVGSKSAFTVLGSLNASSTAKAPANAPSRKKERRAQRERERAAASVVDDWEAEMDRMDRQDADVGRGRTGADVEAEAEADSAVEASATPAAAGSTNVGARDGVTEPANAGQAGASNAAATITENAEDVVV